MTSNILSWQRVLDPLLKGKDLGPAQRKWAQEEIASGMTTPGPIRAYQEAGKEPWSPHDSLRASLLIASDLVSSVSGDRLEQDEVEGEWTARQILVHLADTELVWGVRLRMVLTQERPLIPTYDQEVWVERFSQAEEAKAALDRWRTLRHNHLRMVDTLTDQQLERVGQHPERGDESARVMIAILAGHDLCHLDQLRATLA